MTDEQKEKLRQGLYACGISLAACDICPYSGEDGDNLGDCIGALMRDAAAFFEECK